EARVGSQLPRNGVGWTRNIDPSPMASGAPAAKLRIANAVANPARSGDIGGGCQGNGPPEYAHAVPPSLNAGAMGVLVQRAYFSAWRMVFDVPSGMSVSMRALPCGLSANLFAITMALGA